jgi:hypothetical protein
MMSENTHYELDENLDVKRSHTQSGCIAYLLEREGEVNLCIVGPAAYHMFPISERTIARLCAECAGQLWQSRLEMD